MTLLENGSGIGKAIQFKANGVIYTNESWVPPKRVHTCDIIEIIQESFIFVVHYRTNNNVNLAEKLIFIVRLCGIEEGIQFMEDQVFVHILVMNLSSYPRASASNNESAHL